MTRPVSTGSLPIANTIGMVAVAALAASAAGIGLAKSTVHHAANVQLSDGGAQYSADDGDLLEKICATAKAAAESIHFLDTSSESELFTDAVCTGLLIGKDTRGIDVFCIWDTHWPERVKMMQAWADYLDELRDRE